MPWSETNTMDLRYAAVKEYLTGNFAKKEICEAYHISRPTLDKWVNRFIENGKADLLDRSRRPKNSPHKTSLEVEELILELNYKKNWFCKKIHSHLKLKYPHLEIPSKSTVHNILQRNDRTTNYRKYRKWAHPGKPFAVAEKPNDVMCADYKGDFLLGDRSRCYPLTISDMYSRALLGAFALPGVHLKSCKKGFEKVFQEYGLPKVILTDNGIPFVNKGIDGITKLSAWWTSLGIKHLRTQLASPQQNAQHERMHREMKRVVTRPPGKNMRAQQRKLDEFRVDYNENLEHGGIGDVPPMSIYEKSNRKFPEKIEKADYPLHFDVRRISAHGSFRWNNIRVPLSSALHGNSIGLEEIDDGLYKIWYYSRFLGFFDEDNYRIEDKPGRFERK